MHRITENGRMDESGWVTLALRTDYLALFMIFFIADEYITHARPFLPKTYHSFSFILMIVTITCDREFSDNFCQNSPFKVKVYLPLLVSLKSIHGN